MTDASVVWLASYPRSGNTWVLSMLAEVAKATDAFTLAVGDDRSTIERWSGIDTAALPHDIARSVRADVWRDVSDLAPHPVVAKVHDRFSDACSGGVIPVDATRAALYVVRHPADVVASFSPFIGTGVDTTIELLADRPVGPEELRITDGREHLGSWSEHVAGWLDAPFDVCLLRYEDLLADPKLALVRALAAIGTSCPPGVVDDAVAACTFERLQRREDEHGTPVPTGGTGRFFRHGRAGQGDELLSSVQRDRLWSDHGSVMARLGYR